MGAAAKEEIKERLKIQRGKGPGIRDSKALLTLYGVKISVPAPGSTYSSQLVASHVATVHPLQATEKKFWKLSSLSMSLACDSCEL